ncbi:MAG: PHP domain-containing protein [Firmicutes bacterium]|nr:PHP domain-containing protein [Bacillota bacterium]
METEVAAEGAMIDRDYHMHTNYCDGSNTAEEMVEAALAKGLAEMGISGHSHTAFDESYCMSIEETDQYRQEILALMEKYRDQISIRIGLEVDRYSDADTSPFDYTIGSVHYIRVPDPGAGFGAEAAAAVPAGCLPYTEDGQAWIYIPMDETAEITRAAADA